MTYGSVKEYGLFDCEGAAFNEPYTTIQDAMAGVGTLMRYRSYRPLFPVTIEALDSADIYTVVATIAWENAL